MDDFVPDFETASNLIKQCGGLVFIPHIYEYKNNANNILNFILNNYSIDGIECYYTTFSNEQHFNLLNICKKNKLFISGGSDFHGKYKPDVDIKIVYSGLRPGEKLFEEKLMAEEGMMKTDNELIHIGKPIPFDTEMFLGQLGELARASYNNDENIVEMVEKIVPTFSPVGDKPTGNKKYGRNDVAVSAANNKRSIFQHCGDFCGAVFMPKISHFFLMLLEKRQFYVV